MVAVLAWVREVMVVDVEEKMKQAMKPV